MLKKMRLSKFLAKAMVFSVLLGVPVSVSASGSSTDLYQQIIAGDLTVESVGDVTFGTVELDGNEGITTASAGRLVVTDATGTGAGYRVNVSATIFEDGEGNTLPGGSLVLLSRESTTITPVGGTNAVSPTLSASFFDLNRDGQVELLSAGAGEGMGVFNIDFPADSFELYLNPATTILGAAGVSNFTSTVMYSIIAGV